MAMVAVWAPDQQKVPEGGILCLTEDISEWFNYHSTWPAKRSREDRLEKEKSNARQIVVREKGINHDIKRI